MNPPKISVIIPVYNAELYLADTLKSVRQQIFTNFECICINDGSMDKSEEIMDEFIRTDSRFSKINQQNRGVSSARNAGMNHATGEYILFVDHDDLIPDYTLQKLLSAAEKYNADMIRGRKIMIAEDFTPEELPKNDKQNKKEQFFDNPLTDFYRHVRGKYKSWCHIWQCLFKHSVIEDLRFVEELQAGGEDNLFMYEVISKIKNFVQIDAVVTCHRFSRISVTLNGLNPFLIKMFNIKIPYIYKKYAMDDTIDKRLLWWVYHKESYAVYHFLIRDTIRANQKELLQMAREILLKFNGTPELNEIVNRWSFRQKTLFRLLMNEKFRILKRLRILI